MARGSTKVTVKRMVDTDPDTSYLGKYSNDAETEYAIDRKHSQDCHSVQEHRKDGRLMQSKTFDTSTIQGLKTAERFKVKLENQYDKVIVTAIGFNRVRIEGRASIKPV